MITKQKVLIIEDHPFVIEAYKSILRNINSVNEQFDFIIDIAYNYDIAHSAINDAATTARNNIDIIILDIIINPSPKEVFSSGDDLGILIKKLLPNTKIIIITSLNDSFRIHNLIENINPIGFLIKCDMTIKGISDAILSITNGIPYYSQTVIELLRKQISAKFQIDDIDRRLLFELSNGARLRDLQEILPLSTAGIEKRRRRLRVIFDIDNQNDRDLVIEAKERGFI